MLQQLLFTMEMEVAKELPLNRGKDESTTNYYRLLYISATSSSRMEDVYTNSYYCRLKDEYTTNYYRMLDISATSSSRMQGLKQVAHLRVLPRSRVYQELFFNMEMEVAINSSQYC